MNLADFNGHYQVVIASNIDEFAPGYHDYGDVIITINDGLFSGVDSGGISFAGTLALDGAPSQNHVMADVTVDPRTGVPDAVVMHYDGVLRREPVNHRLSLKVSHTPSGYMLRGHITIGPIRIDATMQPAP